MRYPIVNLNKRQIAEVKKFNQDKNINFQNLNCIVCGFSDYKILFKNDRYGINQQTVMCKSCGFVYSNPRMSKESLDYFYSSNLYRELYEEYDSSQIFAEKIKKIDNNFKIKKPNFKKYYSQLFIDFICSKKINFKTVCEIGCGYGNNLIYFKKIGKEVYGIEPSENLVNLAIKHNLNVQKGFVNDLNIKYDLIVLKHVFEHLYNPLDELKKIYKYSNKYLFIEVPGNFKRLSSIQNAHNFYFTENTLHKIVTQAGFKILSTEYCEETEFIFALYKKDETFEKNISYNYNYRYELKKTNKIYRNEKLRFLISSVLKKTGIHKFIAPIYRKISR